LTCQSLEPILTYAPSLRARRAREIKFQDEVTGYTFHVTGAQVTLPAAAKHNFDEHNNHSHCRNPSCTTVDTNKVVTWVYDHSNLSCSDVPSSINLRRMTAQPGHQAFEVWEDYRLRERNNWTLVREHRDGTLSYTGINMQYYATTKGKKPHGGYHLSIALHSGGGELVELNNGA